MVFRNELSEYKVNNLYLELATLISKHTKLDLTSIVNLMRIPPSLDFGDVSFPCFTLSKTLKKAPNLIAEELAEVIKAEFLEKVLAVNGYLNFYFDKKHFVKCALVDISKKDFGKNNHGANKKVIVEMSSPNIAKSFGIGHLRSTIIGESLARIYEFNGYKSIKINYLGDWGTQFGKLLLAFELYGDEKKLLADPINHLQDVYVKLNQNLTEELEVRAKQNFKLMEEGDKKTLATWKKFKEKSIEEFMEIYDLLGVSFDEISGESTQNKKSLEIINKLKDKKIAKQSEGALIIDFEDDLGVGILQKSDGTTIYLSRDISAAIERKEKYDFEEMIYEVGSEQELHFKQVFKALKLMGYKWADNLKHITHGLYLGKDGKKLSTRGGSSVKMRDIWAEVESKVLAELKKRDSAIDSRLKLITRSAVLYGDLKNFRNTSVIFDAKSITSMEGDTGPYLLYSYARSKSILRKLKFKTQKIGEVVPEMEEYSLIVKLGQFPYIVLTAKLRDDPSQVANYVMSLSQEFNSFYTKCKVQGSDKEDFRASLVYLYAETLKKALNLIGIDTIEEM